MRCRNHVISSSNLVKDLAETRRIRVLPLSHSAAFTAPSAKPRRDLASWVRSQAVAIGFERYCMRSGDIAFANGSDAQFFTAILLEDLLQLECGAGGCVFFVDVVDFFDRSTIAVLQSFGGEPWRFRRRDSRRRRSWRRRRSRCRSALRAPRTRSSSPYQPVVPTTMFFPAAAQASMFLSTAAGSREVDDDIDVAEGFFGQGAAIAIVGCTEHANLMLALEGDSRRPAIRFCRGRAPGGSIEDLGIRDR